jgi:hypothetical protein
LNDPCNFTARAAPSLVEAYEQLRGSATGAPVSWDSLGGRTILARQGMAAWMRAGAPAARPTAAPMGSTSPALLQTSVHHEVIEILTTMALTTAQEARI